MLNCLESVARIASEQGWYNFRLEEDAYNAKKVRLAQTNEFASTVLLKDDRLVSRYLERANGRFIINEVEINIDLGAGLEIIDFYFD